MTVFQLQTINAIPAKRLGYVPTEAEIIARLRKSREPADREKAAERAAAWAAWIADTKERGVIEPVKVIKISLSMWEVVDGRNRLAAAKAAGLTHIPAVEVTEEEVTGLIISTLAHRKGVSKGGIAYLALTLHSYLAGRGKGRKEKPGDRAFNSLHELAASVGVGDTTMDDAVATYLFLKDKPAQKLEIEPAVIAGLITLAAARAGAASSAKTKGKARNPSSYGTATTTIRSLTSQLREYEKWKEPDQVAAEKCFRQAFAGLTPATRQMLTNALTLAEEGGAE